MATGRPAPGVMIFFDIWRDILKRGDDYAGKMLRAYIDYADGGAVPDFGEWIDCFIWERLKGGADRSIASYERRTEQAQYAGYCSAKRRELGREGIEPNEIERRLLSFDEWKDAEECNGR